MRGCTGLLIASVLMVSACAPPKPVADLGTPAGKPPAISSGVQNASVDARLRLEADSQQRAQWARDAIREGSRRPLTVAEAQRTIARSLRDPESARFTEVRRDVATGAVCGMVNGKNLYGAYSGAIPFVYFHASEASVPQVLTHERIGPAIRVYVEAFCSSATEASPADRSPARQPAAPRPAAALDRT